MLSGPDQLLDPSGKSMKADDNLHIPRSATYLESVYPIVEVAIELEKANEMFSSGFGTFSRPVLLYHLHLTTVGSDEELNGTECAVGDDNREYE